jgi:hypothetical protein
MQHNTCADEDDDVLSRYFYVLCTVNVMVNDGEETNGEEWISPITSTFKTLRQGRDSGGLGAGGNLESS